MCAGCSNHGGGSASAQSLGRHPDRSGGAGFGQTVRKDSGEWIPNYSVGMKNVNQLFSFCFIS